MMNEVQVAHTCTGDPMKKSEAKAKSRISNNKTPKRGKNQSPISRARAARKLFMASDRYHEKTNIEVAKEIFGVTLQYYDDALAYEQFCKREYFSRMAKRPGKKLDLRDVPNAVAQYVCNATIRRRKKAAYKIGRVVECCLLEKIPSWGFDDFIASHGSFTKAYNYAVKTYSRSADESEVTGSSSDLAAEQEVEAQNAGESPARDDKNSKQDTHSAAIESDKQQTPNRRKPDWPKSERSVNIQAITDEVFSVMMAVGPEDDRWVLIGGRPYDGNYVDLYIKEVLPENAVMTTRRPTEG